MLKARSGRIGIGLDHALSAKACCDGALDNLTGILPHLRRLAEACADLTHADTRTPDAEALLHAQATAILLVVETG